MNVKVNAQDFELTPAIEAYARSKFEKLWGRFDVVSAQLRLRAGPAGSKVARADIRLKGSDVHIEESEPDLYAAIDKLAAATHVRLSKAKEMRSGRGL